jgi:hypothetical protein
VHSILYQGILCAVRESDGDLSELQALLDRSLNAAGDHLRSIFGDEHQLTAEQVVAALDGIFEMHLAVVTLDGAPLVAPTDGLFLRGKVWFGLLPHAVRTRLVRRNPRVSASHSRGEFAFIVHGTAHEVDESNPAWPDYEALLRELYVAEYGPGFLEWFERLRQDRGSGFTGYIEPRVLFAKG